jgi:hypothetical protein
LAEVYRNNTRAAGDQPPWLAPAVGSILAPNPDGSASEHQGVIVRTVFLSAVVLASIVVGAPAAQASNGQTRVSPDTIPEPAAVALLGLGLIGAGYAHRRRP